MIKGRDVLVGGSCAAVAMTATWLLARGDALPGLESSRMRPSAVSALVSGSPGNHSVGARQIRQAPLANDNNDDNEEGFRAREEALALREAALREREESLKSALLSAAPQAKGDSTAVAADSDDAIREKLLADLKDAMEKLTESRRSRPADQTTPDSVDMEAAMSLMGLISTLQKKPDLFDGPFAAGLHSTLVDSMFPSELKMSDSQKERMKAVIDELEERRIKNGLPRLFNPFNMNPNLFPAGTPEWKTRLAEEMKSEFKERTEGILTSEQKAAMDRMESSRAVISIGE